MRVLKSHDIPHIYLESRYNIRYHVVSHDNYIDLYSKDKHVHTHIHYIHAFMRKNINLREMLSLTCKQIYYNSVIYVVLSNFTGVFCMCAIMVVNVK